MNQNERQPLAERSILALMLHDVDARKRALGDGLTGDHFIVFRPVFSAIEELHRTGQPIDAATVAGWINPSEFPDFEIHEQVDEIDAQKPDSSAWTSWVTTIRRSYASRIASDVALAVPELELEGQREILETASEMMKEALAGPSGAVHIKDAANLFNERMKELASIGTLPGVSTGIPQLDDISGGMRPGELWACLGKTSGGKTVLMSQIATSVMLDGRKVAFFSCEMMVDEIVARLIANVGNVDLSRVLQPAKWSQKDASDNKIGDNVVAAVKTLAVQNAWMDDTPRMTMRHIEQEAQRIADQNDGLDLIVVDYMQIVAPDSARKESREQEVARVSGSLKQLAKKMECPVLSASQLNDDGRVRESRAISFDANVMLGIEENGIRVVKMRNGRRDDDGEDPSLKLTLNGSMQRFE